MSGFQSNVPRDDQAGRDEEGMAAGYQEQIQYQQGEGEDYALSMAQQTDDIQSRLAAAAQPLDYSASLEVKFQSYDNYCSLFHFILNSDGPVDLEPPSVRGAQTNFGRKSWTNNLLVLLGLGRH